MPDRSVVLYMPRRFRAIGEGTTQKMPLEVLALAGPLVERGYKVKIIDANVQQNSRDLLVEACRESVCLGISCILGYQIIDGMEAAAEIRKRYPDLPIIWGGWFPSVMPESFLNEGVADLVVMGQGEITFLEVVERLSSGEGMEGVQGVAIRENGQVRITPARDLCQLEDLPAMPFSLLDYETYYQSDPGVPFERYLWAAAKNQRWSRQDMRLLWYMSSWGCPNDCKFCCSGGVTRRRWTALGPKRVIDELGPLTTSNRVDVVSFCDANFFVNRKRVLELCKAKQDLGLEFLWHASADPDTVAHMSGAELTSLSASGCFSLFIGTESGSEETLARVNKKHSPEENEHCAELLVRHNITPILSYIVGTPEESPDSIEMTFEQCRRIKSRYPNASITILNYLPLPGTGLYHDSVKAGFVEPGSLTAWGELGETSYYAGPTFNNLGSSQARTVSRLRHFYFSFIDLPWQKARLGLAERILRRFAVLRVRYGILRLPVEFWAAKAAARLLNTARKLIRRRRVEPVEPNGPPSS
jgi:anaerobic magnesium-protoporphyrin IX monomethyl ester cyclase